MIRTQIQLPEAEYDALRRSAQKSGKSMAACIREGIAMYLTRVSGSDHTFSEIAGRFRPSEDPALKPHDRWWSETALPQGKPGKP